MDDSSCKGVIELADVVSVSPGTSAGSGGGDDDKTFFEVVPLSRRRKRNGNDAFLLFWFCFVLFFSVAARSTVVPGEDAAADVQLRRQRRGRGPGMDRKDPVLPSVMTVDSLTIPALHSAFVPSFTEFFFSSPPSSFAGHSALFLFVFCFFVVFFGAFSLSPGVSVSIEAFDRDATQKKTKQQKILEARFSLVVVAVVAAVVLFVQFFFVFFVGFQRPVFAFVFASVCEHKKS